MERKHKAKMTNYDFLTKKNISLHWELELVKSLISISSNNQCQFGHRQVIEYN